MTLSTYVYLLTEANPADVFMKCRDLLGATTETWRDRDLSDIYGDGVWAIGNDLGQGLPALTDVRYRKDGEMLQAESGMHDEWCDGDCAVEHEPAHWVKVNFDTAYSYHDSYGGCDALHARLLFDLGGWLDERSIQWAWSNEFTGEIHIGDKYEHLMDLCEGGQAAVRWFKGTVEPAIASWGARRVS